MLHGLNYILMLQLRLMRVLCVAGLLFARSLQFSFTILHQLRLILKSYQLYYYYLCIINYNCSAHAKISDPLAHFY